eukprot:1090750-Prymnesium_polylepis.2
MAAHERRRETDNRLDRYRSSVFTPSGRPYDDLPVVTLDAMRKDLASNRASLLRSAVGGASSSYLSPLA